MEKIKRALEQARKDRQHQHPHAGKSGGASKQGEEVKDIEYTSTRTLDCSPSHMREHRLVDAVDNIAYVDAVKILSTQVLQRMHENDWRSLAVTSPRSGAGKTTMTINLGMSIAKELDRTVLVVDAGLREPKVHEYLGISPQAGLGEYLQGKVELPDVLINPKGIKHFVVLPGGERVDASAELLRSPRMTSLVKELTSRYPERVILFDIPSVLDTADAISLLPFVDAALLVVEDDETKQSDLKQALEILSVTNVIGTVLNKSEFI